MRAILRWSFAIAAAVIALGVAARGAGAQDTAAAADTLRAPLPPFRLVGTVRDTLGRPLGGAEVRSGDRADITDSLGQFRLDSLIADPTHIVVRRIGYQPAATTIERQPDVAEIRIGVRLEPSAVQLGTVVVNERRMTREMMRSGYLERERLGNGVFFDEKKLKRAGPTYLSLLGAIAGVEVRFGQFGAIFAEGRTSRGMGRSTCQLDVFLDGMLVRWAADVGISGVVPKEELIAVEVYPRASQVPPYFNRPINETDCGAIALWTRPFEPKSTKK